jgi:hypothetical protein
MVEEIKNVITTYQRCLMEMPYIPATSYGRNALGDEGDANELFLTYLFGNKEGGIQFLKDVELICCNVTCNARGCDMLTTNQFSTLTQLPEPLTSSETNSLADRRSIDPSNNNHKRKKEHRCARHIPNNHRVRTHGQPSKAYRAPGSEIVGGNNSDLKPNLHSAKDYISYYTNDKDSSGTNVKMSHNDHGSTQLIPTMVNGEIRETNNSEIASKRRKMGSVQHG